MKTINISIRDKRAISPIEKLVCGNTDYAIKFDFDEDWSEYNIKTARFVWNGQNHDEPFEGDTVNVPKITNTSLVAVGVYAGDLRTTTPALIATDKSILCLGGLPAEPTPDVYSRLIYLIEERYKVLDRVVNNFIDVSEVGA
jgi:hypothetical protein